MSELIKVRVTNTGDRVRHRLGVSFRPNKTKEVEILKRHLIVLNAVKDFVVEVLEDKKTEKYQGEGNEVEGSSENNKKELSPVEELNYHELTIEEVLEAVRINNLSVDEAIAYEVSGKNRVTLLEKLEELKAEQEEL